jgi:hypothetical protein
MMETYSLFTPSSCKMILGPTEQWISDERHQHPQRQHYDDNIMSPDSAGHVAVAKRFIFHPLSSTHKDQHRKNSVSWLSPCVVVEHHDHQNFKFFDSSSTTTNSGTSVNSTTNTNKKTSTDDATENDRTTTTNHEPFAVMVMNNEENSKRSPSALSCHQVLVSSNKMLTSESLLQTYIQDHKMLASHDHQDAVEICKGAAALCLMKQDQRVGVGSNSYNDRYGIPGISDNDDYDSSDQESGDWYNSSKLHLVQNKHSRQGTDVETDQDITNLSSSPLGKSRRDIVTCMSCTAPNKRQKTSGPPFEPETLATRSTNQTSRKSPHCLLLPTSLALPSDHHNVNKLHAFVRSELLELFQVPFHQHDDHDEEHIDQQDLHTATSMSSRRSTRNTQCKNTQRESLKPNKIAHVSSPRHFPGRVGLRCVYCASVPKKNQQAMPYFYPKGLSDLYRSTCTWQRVHFKNCSYIPSSVKRKYYNLKESDKVSCIIAMGDVFSSFGPQVPQSLDFYFFLWCCILLLPLRLEGKLLTGYPLERKLD